MDPRKYKGKQQRRRRERNSSPRGSGNSLAIVLLTLVITAGAGLGLSIGFGLSFLIGLLLAGLVHLIKRFCLMQSHDDHPTEAEPLKWAGYLLCAAITILSLAYGAHSLTRYITDSAITPDTSRPVPYAKPEGRQSPAVPSFADHDWQELVNRIKSRIEARKVRVSLLEDGDPRKGELGMLLLDAGRSLLRVDIALSHLMDLARNPLQTDQPIVPGSERFDWQLKFVESDWRTPVRELKELVGQLEVKIRFMQDTDPAKSRLLEQIGVVTSWLSNLEAHLSRFNDPFTTSERMAFSLADQGLLPEATPRNEGSGSKTVAPQSPRWSNLPRGFVNFLEAATNGDILAFFLLIVAAILETLLYFKVKQKQHQERRGW